MSSNVMTISIPDAMYRHVKDRVSGDTYNSVSEYFRELIRKDVRAMERRQQAQNAQPTQQPPRARPQPEIGRAQHAQPARPTQPPQPQAVIERPRLASAARRPPLSDRDIESLLRH